MKNKTFKLKHFTNLFIICICILLFNCKKNDVFDKGSKTNDLNWLLTQANNSKISNKKRLEYANLVYDELKKENYDSIIKNKYSILSGVYYNLNDREKFIKICKEIIYRSEKASDFEISGITNYNLGYYFNDKFEGDSAYFYFNKAEKILKNTKRKAYLENVILSKANLLWAKKDYAASESLAVKALKIAQQKNNVAIIYDSYISIANSLAGMNKDKEAIDYYNKALNKNKDLSKNQKIVSRASINNYIANIYQKENQHKKAIEYSKKGLSDKAIKKLDIKVYCYLINNLGYSKLKTNEKDVLPLLNEVLHITDSTKFAPTQIEVKSNLGEYYLSQNDTLKANTFFKDAQILAHKNNIFEDELKILQLLSLSDAPKSGFYTNRYIQLNDSLQNVERATRDKFARIEFETDEITTEKDAVVKEKDQLQQRIWIVTGFAILSLLVIILWFMNKSQKAKTRELLLKQEQQKANEEIYQLMIDQQQKIEEGKQIEKRRISQELHDGVMGRLSSIRLNLFVLNKKTDEETIKNCLNYIKDIQGIEKEIRTIAHDLNKNLFSDSANFVSIVENLFTAIKNHSDIEFNLIADERINWETINNNIKINVFRIIQEALQNIDKYAKASKVLITMTKAENAIDIEINDDGIGFDVKSTKDGIGLKNMKERMDEIGGEITIDSNLNRGTKINLTIPN